MKPKIPKIGCQFISACTIAGVLLTTAAYAESPKNVSIIVNAPSTLTAGESKNLKLTLTPYANTDSLRVDISSSGALTASLSREYDGNDVVVVELPISSNVATKEGEITVRVTGLSGSGVELFTRVSKLYAVEQNDTVYIDDASPLYAKLAAQDSSLVLRKSDGSSLFKAESIETNTQLPAAKRRVSEVLVDQAFPIPQQKVLAARPVTMTVQGTAMWTDSAGGTHSLPGATVEIYDEESTGDVLLATTTTNSMGGYSVGVNHDDLVDGPDIYVRILARSTIADIQPDAPSASTYFMQSTTHPDQADGSTLTVNLTADNTTTAGQSFSIHHALVAGGAYMTILDGSAPRQITTRFPTTESTSLFNGSELHILQLDRWDWDVTLHEYGHYVMDAYNFENNPGGRHSSGTNLSTTRGSKDVGVRLAWGEGWPTFFAVSGLRQMGFASLGIPNVGDLQYQDTEDTSITNHLENDTGAGEDDELSVMTTLWDLVDNNDDGEEISMSARALFQAIKASGPTKIGGVWDSLVQSKTNEEKAAHGKLFGLHKIAPEQLTPSDRATLNTSTSFSWNQNGAGPSNPLNDNHVRFFDSAFTTETHDAAVGTDSTYTPTTADVDAALSSGSLVRWVVTAKNTTAPETPSASTEYWSDVRVLNGASVVFVIDDTGSMSEEISGVSQALDNYITNLESTLAEGEEPPTIHLLTFKDNVTHRLTTNDFSAMRNAVNGLRASGGGDCPEYSAHGLLAASKLVASGGTILLATDASAQPGVDMGAVISDLRTRGVTVNTILSGDCSSSAGEFKPSLVEGIQGKPGFDEEGTEIGGSIDEPGVAEGVDIVGDETTTASDVLLDEVLIGVLEDSDDIDVFKVELEASTEYSVTLNNINENFSAPVLRVLNGEGEAQNLGSFSTSLSATSTTTRTATFTPEEDATYFLELSTRSTTAGYRVVVSDDAFNALTPSSVQLFSVVSAETGGAFAKIDEVNSGDDSEYVNTIFNILRSSTEPAVITSSINRLPRGARATVFFTGLNTNWNADTDVSFRPSDDSDLTGVTISGVTVQSPTSISFDVDVAEDAPLLNLDIIAETTLGSGTEVAEGIGILAIEEVTTAASILSLTPTRLVQGSTATLTIQGNNTAFTDDMVVDLGSTVTVNSVDAISDTEATINVTVNDTAPVGFRSITVGSLRLSEALLIGTESSVAVIDGISPSTLNQSQTTSVTITGTNTNFEEGVTTASFGDNVVVNSVTVNSATEAVVNITVGEDAAIGFRNITLETNSESATLLDGLQIEKADLVIATNLVPNLIHLTQAEAEAAIVAAGFTVGRVSRTKSNTVSSGDIYSQNPLPESVLEPGSAIDIVVSRGKRGALSMSPIWMFIMGTLGAIALRRNRRKP